MLEEKQRTWEKLKSANVDKKIKLSLTDDYFLKNKWESDKYEFDKARASRLRKIQ